MSGNGLGFLSSLFSKSNRPRPALKIVVDVLAPVFFGTAVALMYIGLVMV